MSTVKLNAAGHRWVGELADFRFSISGIGQEKSTWMLTPFPVSHSTLTLNVGMYTEELDRYAVRATWEGSVAAKKHDVAYVAAINLAQSAEPQDQPSLPAVGQHDPRHAHQ